MKNINIGGILLVIFTSILVITVGFSRVHPGDAKKVYMVYLEGKKIGLIQEKDELYNLIDNEQKTIKTTFGVESVYPPASLEAVEYTTYSDDLKSPEDIYSIIEESSSFTIEGYTVTIKPDEGDPIYINILNREDLEPALRDAVSAFVPLEGLDAYIKDSQVEITETGKKIENVYFEERITVKENLLNVNDMIITNQSDLTKYLLFGTLENQKQYTVKEGDTVEKVAFNNMLSNEELLIANPNLSSVNSLLSPGQVLNIGLINPLFTIVEDSEVIEDIKNPYKIITETSSRLYIGETIVRQEGVDGVDRVTEKIQTKNGQVTNLVIVPGATKTISAAVDRIVVRGTTPSYNFSNIPPASSSTDWGWPTISPYVITSTFKWRWGKLHSGIDISGSGFGSPIYSSTDGVVTETFSGCADRGYYGSSCGGGYGNYVYIKSTAGLTIYYAHIKSAIPVRPGQTVTKGQLIGYMGNSGSSTGTHLHFEIKDGNVSYDPCKVAFRC